MFENIDEIEQLRRFQSPYKHVTGEFLQIVRKSERPDYICKRPDGSLVGIEFTIITRDPESSSWDQILEGIEFMNGLDGLESVAQSISAKGAKLKAKNTEAPVWQLPNSSILVLSTPDCQISEIEKHLDNYTREELAEVCIQSGFSEIWIADHTEVEAYGNIKLFGLFPQKYWGSHPPRHRGKPYF